MARLGRSRPARAYTIIEHLVPTGTSVSVTLQAASVTVTAHTPTPFISSGANLQTSSVTVTAHSLSPVYSKTVSLAVAANTVTAHPVTATATVPTIVNLRTAVTTVTARPLVHQAVVGLSLATASVVTKAYRLGPPNPLTMSMSPYSGTDNYGNSYQPGFHVYSGSTNGSRISLQSTNDVYGALPTITYTPPASTNITLTPQTFGYQNNGGASNQQTWLIHTSGKTNSQDDAAILLTGAAGDGSTGAGITFEFGGSLAMTVTKTLITADIPFDSLPMVKGPPFVLPDTNKGQLYVDTSGNLVYYSPGGTATVVVAGP